MLSLFATFFTFMQQRELSFVCNAPALRLWLSDGVPYTNGDGQLVYRSSMAALHILSLPSELLSIAIALVIGGMVAYLASALVESVRLSTGGYLGNVAVIVAFAVGVGFAFSLFFVLLGSKSKEMRAAKSCASPIRAASTSASSQQNG
jgi:hypothetical protein